MAFRIKKWLNSKKFKTISESFRKLLLFSSEPAWLTIIVIGKKMIFVRLDLLIVKK